MEYGLQGKGKRLHARMLHRPNLLCNVYRTYARTERGIPPESKENVLGDWRNWPNSVSSRYGDVSGKRKTFGKYGLGFSQAVGIGSWKRWHKTNVLFKLVQRLEFKCFLDV